MTIAFGGLDLSTAGRRSAACIIRGDLAYLSDPLTDDEIVDALKSAAVVAVDAPLTGPPERGHRAVDRLMIRMGFPVLPASWPFMRALTERATRIARLLRAMGVEVVETHPTSALRSSGCRSALELAGRVGVRVEARRLTDDEADALVAAIVAMSYYSGQALLVREVDGEVALLRPLCKPRGLGAQT